MNYVKNDTKMEKKIYDYDPYVLFDDWSSAVFDKLHHDVYGAEEEELVDIFGKAFMVVDGVVQDVSLCMFFTELLSRLGVYGEDGYKVMDEDDAIKLICSAKGMEEVTAMFKEYNIKFPEDGGEVLVSDFLTANEERVANDLKCAEYLRLVYGGERTIDGLIEYLSEYVNRKK